MKIKSILDKLKRKKEKHVKVSVLNPLWEGYTPVTTPDSDSIIPDSVFDDIEFFLPQVLGEKYHNIQFWKEGGTRLLFTADWGPGNEKRVIKVDKVMLRNASPRSLRHVERGYVTANDMDALAQLPADAEQHGLMRLLDYADLSEFGRGKVVVEPFFNSQSLEEKVASEGAVSFKNGKDLFGKIFHAADYFVTHTGRLHRDPKPANILVGVGAQAGNVRITDFANSRSVFDKEIKYLPTAGSTQVTDWQLYGTLTGKETVYDEKSEVYAYGMSYLFARLGKQFVDIDPDKRTAVALDTGESLLNDEGMIDKTKYNSALKRAIKGLSRKERKFVQRALTSDLDKRYSTLDELVQGFDKMHRPGLLGHLKQHQNAIMAAVGVTMAGTAMLTVYSLDKYNEKKEAENAAEVAEAQKYEVTKKWNGVGPELVNNLVDLDVSVHTDNTYKDPDYYSYPADAYIKVKPGNMLDLYANLKERPRPRGSEEKYSTTTPYHLARAYIEGLPLELEVDKDYIKNVRYLALNMGVRDPTLQDAKLRNEFYLRALSTDGTEEMHEGAFGGVGMTRFNVPKELPDGTYILAVEVYEPTNSDINGVPGSKNLRYSSPGKILARKRIPIIVGEPSVAPDLSYVQLNDFLMGSGMHFKDLIGSGRHPTSGTYGINARDLDVQTRVPEENYSSDNDAGLPWRFKMPDVRPQTKDDLNTRTLEITVRDKNNKVVLYTALPVQRKYQFTNPSTGEKEYRWGLSEWDKSASEFLAGRRPDIDYESIVRGGKQYDKFESK